MKKPTTAKLVRDLRFDFVTGHVTIEEYRRQMALLLGPAYK